jgi:hypothetical protein
MDSTPTQAQRSAFSDCYAANSIFPCKHKTKTQVWMRLLRKHSRTHLVMATRSFHTLVRSLLERGAVPQPLVGFFYSYSRSLLGKLAPAAPRLRRQRVAWESALSPPFQPPRYLRADSKVSIFFYFLSLKKTVRSYGQRCRPLSLTVYNNHIKWSIIISKIQSKK